MNFRAEIDKLTPGLRRYARALVLDEHDGRSDAADALVQQTILRALPHERALDGVGLRNYLYSTLIEANQTRLRRSPPRPAQAQHGAHHAAGISESLEALSPDDRAALLLVTLEGLGYADVAEILRIPRAALVQKLVRARTQLSAAFEVDSRRAAHPYLRLVK